VEAAENKHVKKKKKPELEMRNKRLRAFLFLPPLLDFTDLDHQHY